MRYTVVSLCILLLLIPTTIQAQDLFPEELLPTIATDPEHTLKGENYQLELAPLESESTKIPPKPVDQLSKKERLEFDSKGFIYEQTKGEMSISLSSSRIGLNNITDSGEHIGQIEISVTSTTPTRYSLLTSQTSTNDAEYTWPFPATLCNGAQETCTPLQAHLWTQDKRYGLGYTLSGLDILPDFKNNAYFRPFRIESPVLIAKNEKIEGIRTLKMGFKLQTPSSIEEAVYNTNVEVIALSK